MRLHLVAVGRRMPDWIENGFSQYNKRLPKQYQLQLHRIATAKHHADKNCASALERECAQIIKTLPKASLLVALAVDGQPWSTELLAQKLKKWSMHGQDTVFLVGGPNGIAMRCLEMADQRWSLSNLTLPHSLIRVVLAEQIYRAWTILQGHPYHR